MTDLAPVFSQRLFDAAAQDPRLFVVLNDSAETHGATEFSERYPERFIDVGIAEQNMVDIAVGLARNSFLPFVHSAACFLSRAMEQIKIAAYMGADVTLCGFVAGMAYGPLGGTHHALEDLAWMRAIPGLRIACPATSLETKSLLDRVIADPAPTYLRIGSKYQTAEFLPEHYEFAFGKGYQVGTGSDVTVVSTGIMSNLAIDALTVLEENGIAGRVLHMPSIKPIDAGALEECASATERLVVIEDHQRTGGLTSAVADVLIGRKVQLDSLSVPDQFAPIGSPGYLHENYGLSVAGIAERCEAQLRGGNHARW